MNTSLSLALAAAVLAASPFASAHARLAASLPAAGQVLDAPPTEIHLTFDEHVEPRYSAIKLVSDQGKNFDCDRPHADPADPMSLVASVPVLRSGVYRARWTAVGGDGHKTHGDFSFTIK
jgi:methionine-rich copper-binding protein CopC